MRSRNATLTESACEALDQISVRQTPSGWEVRFATILPRKVYVEVNDLLERLGGRWSTKLQAHVFPADDCPLTHIQAAVETGAAPDKSPDAYFCTTEPVVAAILHALHAAPQLLPTDKPVWILEPEAGTGALVRALVDLNPYAKIDAVEYDYRRYGSLCALESGNVCVHNADFLTWEPPGDRRYHRVAMNPPFAIAGDPKAYIAHIQRAFAFLRPGGRLVSVAPIGLYQRADRRSCQLRKLVEECGHLVDLPEGAFRASGTDVKTCLVVLNR